MFKRWATDLDTQLTTTQRRLTFTLNNARLLPEGYITYIYTYIYIYIYMVYTFGTSN